MTGAVSELAKDARLSPVLTPQGHLLLEHDEHSAPLGSEIAQRLQTAFKESTGHGLLTLGAELVGVPLPAVIGYWRDFAARYVSAVCAAADPSSPARSVAVAPPSHDALEQLAAAMPPIKGAEYACADVLTALWREIDAAFRDALASSGASVQAYLKRCNSAWNLVGRVHFNLAENHIDDAAPFAFLATYTPRLSAQAKAQHLPLGEALREYAGAAQRESLLSLLLPVQRAAQGCAWLKAMVDAGEIFHPLRWSAQEAFRLLHDVPLLESAGVVVRVPGTWGGKRPPRPQVSGTVGAKPASGLGLNALLDFDVQVTLDGQTLTRAEIEHLLAGSDGLALIRGRWVELDRRRLERMLARFEAIERTADEGKLGFAEAMRLLAGAEVGSDATRAVEERDWARITAGPWLADTLAKLRAPGALGRIEPGQGLKTRLRPYQDAGVRWLHMLGKLGLGGCLADDMGLGKTIQVLALLLLLRRERDTERCASLLVAPASLLANWAAEIGRFAPDLKAIVAHPSAMPPAELKTFERERIAGVDLVITSYGSLLRLPWCTRMAWRLAILDEAQAIKNPAAKQTRAVKQLDARMRIALTGTPIENRLSDLWSIFDFVNPGLLGSAKVFAQFTKQLSEREGNAYAPLHDLVRPYILRRLKTDKSVISDLPEKSEVIAYCSLSRKQAALYQRAVEELEESLAQADGIQRKGTVLAYLMRFKQICNHPSQWLGNAAWAERDSGKFSRLREIAEVIAARQEKALVFTQFREVTGPLAAFLGSVFGRLGPTLHGETPVRERQKLVQAFQEDETIPFIVLSLKAGGAGLNLTAASHVIHFDRWWNPAVENQATDRAYRIGQKKNVLVHKFVCRGTVEDRIDALIASKQKLSQDLLESGAELALTEMNDKELLDLFRMDIRIATQEA
ncbi:MAG: DEAD/DEAH box helicase [Burkholderiales bacterium]|nr:DEAD/DEAH box helicase [Burkholderiales bacterium]